MGASHSSSELLSELQQRRKSGWNNETDCIALFRSYDRNGSSFLEKEEADRFFLDLLSLVAPNATLEVREKAVNLCWDEFDNNPRDEKIGLDELEVAINQCFDPGKCTSRGLFSTKFAKFTIRDFILLVGFNQPTIVKQVLEDTQGLYLEHGTQIDGCSPLHLALYLGHSQLVDLLLPRSDLWNLSWHPTAMTGSNYSVFHCLCLGRYSDAERLALFERLVDGFLQRRAASASPAELSNTNEWQGALKSEIGERLFLTCSHPDLPRAGAPLELLARQSSSLCLRYLLENFPFKIWDLVMGVFSAAAVKRLDNIELIMPYVFTPVPLSEVVRGAPTHVAKRLDSFAHRTTFEALLEPNLAEMLLRAFAEPNLKKEGEYGLDLSLMLSDCCNGSASERARRARALLEFGVDPNITDLNNPKKHDQSFMDGAFNRRDIDMIALLIEYGAEPAQRLKYPPYSEGLDRGLRRLREKMLAIVEFTPMKEVWLASIIIEYAYGHALEKK